MAKTIVGHLVYQVSGESRELDVALANSKKKTSDFTRFIKSAVGIGGAVIAFRALIGTVKDLVRAYSAQEEAEAGLAAAIQARGGNVNALMIKYKEFASTIQSVTTIGDEEALSLVKQGEALEINRDQMEEAVKGAIGLSKAFNIDMNTALRGIALALQGNYAALSRYIPQLRTAGSEAEKQAILQRVMANSFKIVRAETVTGTGAFKQYNNLMGELREEGGRAILDFMKPFIIEMNRELAVTLRNLQARRLLNRALKGEATSVEEVDAAMKSNNDRRVRLISLLRTMSVLNAKGIPMYKTLIQQLADEGFYVMDTTRARTDAVRVLGQEVQKTSEHADALAREREELAKLLEVSQPTIVTPELIQDEEALWKLRMAAINQQAEQERQQIVESNNFRLARIEEEQQKEADQQQALWEQQVAAGAQRIEQERQQIVDNNEFRLSQQEQELAKERQKQIEHEQMIQQLKADTWDFVQGLMAGLDDLNQAQLSRDLALLQKEQDAKLANFQGTEEEREALQQEFEKRRARLEYDAALKSWRLQLMGALAALARSIVEAAKNAWPIPALPMMAMAGILGGLQIAAIRKAKPVPQFAEGGEFDIPPGFENDTFPMLGSSGEHVKITPAGMAGDTPLQARIYVDGKQLWDIITTATRSGKVLIAQRAVVK